MIDADVSVQTCRRCSALLPVSEFHADKSRKTGYRTVCKACRSEASAGTASTVVNVFESAPVTTDDEAVALAEATRQLIETHKTHFEHILYSIRVRMGLESAGQRGNPDPERAKFYGVGFFKRRR